MTIVVNGKDETLPDATPLAKLLATRTPRPPFAVEINRKLVRRSEYDGVTLCEGDRVEIVTLVGGG